jgi:hypothetical protein
MHIEPLDKKVGLLYVIHDDHGMISHSGKVVSDTVVGILRIGPYNTQDRGRTIFPINYPGFERHNAHLTFEEDTSHITPAEFRKRFFQKRLPWMFRNSLANDDRDGQIFERVIENRSDGIRSKGGYHLCSAVISLEKASKLTTSLAEGHFFYIDVATAKAIQKVAQKHASKTTVPAWNLKRVKKVIRKLQDARAKESQIPYGPNGLHLGISFSDPVILKFVVEALEWHTTILHRIKQEAWDESGKRMVYR